VGIGTSIFLIATGAILKYGITARVAGVSIDTIGVILMIVGVVGLLLSLLWATIYADRRRADVAAPATAPTVRERDIY